MIRYLTYLACGMIVCLSLWGCMEEEAAAPAPKKTTAAPPPAQKPVPTPEAQAEAPKEAEFVYTREGRRDPFVPLSQIRRPIQPTEESEPETPLQSYDVSQFRLVGLIVGKGEPKAMVVAPDGKSYVLSRGVKIGKNNGVIVDISSNAVSVKEKYYDFSGNVIENIQEITVPKREGV